MNSISIRTAQQHDLEELNQLMFALHDWHHQQCPEHFKTAQDIEEEKSIAQYLDNPECIVFMAIEAGKVIGFITGHFCELISSVSKPVMMGSIDELYVVESFRKTGVATRLCDEMNQRFTDYGVKQVFVEVWNFNQQAQKLYQSLDFEHHIHCLRKSLVNK